MPAEPNPPNDPNTPEDAQACATSGASEVRGDLTPEELAAASSATRKMTNATGGGLGLWQPPSVEEAAGLFPQYEVLGLLGRGGMGAVYKAKQIALDRLVAIKLLPLEISTDADFADRFRREARAMAKLHHPGIITVFDFGTTSAGHLFFVMEFVDGGNLHQIIHGPGLEPAQALSITMQVCEALAFAHEQGVVHRDIKPANVMVDQRGRAKVADFGLARLTDPSAEPMGHTMTGTVMGTPDYMAPEQMKGMNVDHRADIYSLGVMLYEMLCQDIPRGFFDPPSARAGVDTRLDEVVRRAMQQLPERRYQQTAEMRTDVEQVRATMLPPSPSVLASVASTAGGQRAVAAASRSTDSAVPPTPPRKSKVGLMLAIAAAVLVLGALAFVFTRPAKPAAKTNVVASTQPLEPGAIKLWDSPESVTDKQGASFENGVLRLENRGVSFGQERDAEVRVSIRANPEAKILHVRLRDQRDGKPAYILAPYFKDRTLQLRMDRKVLQTWPLPRTYGPDEWVPFEFRVVGDELTVSVEGKLLGTARDKTLAGPDPFTLYASGTGYFRDVVYVPLDKPAPAAPASSVPPTSRPPPSALAWSDAVAEYYARPLDKQWNKSFTKVPEGAKVTDGSSPFYVGGNWRRNFSKNQAVRATISRMNGWATLFVRDQDGRLRYNASLNPDGRIEIHFERRQGPQGEIGEKEVLKKFGPLPGFDKNQRHVFEFRAEEDLLTVLVDGKEIGSVRDSRHNETGTMLFTGAKDTILEKLEYAFPASGPAGSSPAATPPPAAPSQSGGSPWVDGLADWWERNKDNKEAVSRFVREAGGWRVAEDSEKSSWGVTAWGLERSDVVGDAVIRATVSGAPYWRIALREDPDTKLAYIATLTGNVGSIAAQLERAQPSTVLKTFALPSGFVVSDPHAMEFRVQGDVLTLLLDGREKLRLQDSRLKAGIGRVVAPPGALIEKLEYQILTPQAAPVRFAATKDAPFINSLGMKFVPVPISGGPSDGKPKGPEPAEGRVLFSVWETRVQDYELFAKETKREWPKVDFEQGPTHPAVNVSWDDATAFCTWLTTRERQAGRMGAGEAYRLPSDHEWSCAAGLGEREDGTRQPGEKDASIPDAFPWGSQWPLPPGAGNYAGEELQAARGDGKHDAIKATISGYRDAHIDTAPVGQYPANGWGLYDLGGNAGEWCADWMDATQQYRVLRGGAWTSFDREHLLSSNRSRGIPNIRTSDLGFRVVLAPAP